MAWMQQHKAGYLAQCRTPTVAVQRMVTDANVDCGTEVPERELSNMAREIFANELAAERLLSEAAVA